jgi:nicotinate phosphoribosyltransferase
VAGGAPIDGYGVGTTIVTSADAAYLECAYKLQSYDGRATRKRSAGKATMPGRKQVYRQFDGEGRMCGDTVTLFDQPVAGDALLQPMMKNGKRLEPAESIDVARDRVREGLQQLPEAVRSLGQRAIYPVTVAESVQQLCNEVDRDLPAIDNNEG